MKLEAGKNEELVNELRECSASVQYAILQSVDLSDVQGSWASVMDEAAQRIMELENELEQFSKWAQRCGHYQVVGLIENYRRFREET